MLPNVVSNLVEARVSVNRIKSFLLAGEIDLNATRRLPSLPPRPSKTSTTVMQGDVEVHLSDELDDTSVDESHCAVWMRNGAFKYDTKPPGDDDAPAAAGKGGAGGSPAKKAATVDKRQLLSHADEDDEPR